MIPKQLISVETKMDLVVEDFIMEQNPPKNFYHRIDLILKIKHEKNNHLSIIYLFILSCTEFSDVCRFYRVINQIFLKVLSLVNPTCDDMAFRNRARNIKNAQRNTNLGRIGIRRMKHPTFLVNS